MTQQKTDWKTFIARRRLDVQAWLKANGIADHEGLVRKCESLGVTPPDELAELKQPAAPPVEPAAPAVEVVEVEAPTLTEVDNAETLPVEEAPADDRPARRKKKRPTNEAPEAPEESE